MKLMIQVPTVTPSVRIAAVEGCSVIDAVAAARAIVNPAFNMWPNITVASSGGYRLPPYDVHSTPASAGAADAISQPAKSTTVLAAMRARADDLNPGCCSSILSAPLWRSPDTRRMPTNGSMHAAASSHALKVGAQMPTSGENASPTPWPTAVPLRPLASA